MDVPKRPAATYRKAPFFLQLRSLDTATGDLWTISLDADILTLLRPDNTVALTVHRQEAARYLHFAYDLLRGMTIFLIIVEGLKRYAFRCHRDQVAKLLSWLPHRTPEEMTAQVRYSAIAMVLFGIFHLLLPNLLFWFWGIALAGAGVAGVVRPLRRMYAVNGAVLFLAGLWDLLTGTPQEIRPWNVPPEDRWIPVIVGSAIILWAVHQISMLGPNQQLRVARTIRDQCVSFLPERSPLVRRIGYANAAAAVLFCIYATVMLAVAPLDASEIAAGFHPAWREAIVFGILGLLATGGAAVCLLRKHPAYFEAKTSAQLLIAVVLFSLWGLAANVRAATTPHFSGVIPGDFRLFMQAHIWVSLLVCVLVFNRWFLRALDRELEEQRG